MEHEGIDDGSGHDGYADGPGHEDAVGEDWGDHAGAAAAGVGDGAQVGGAAESEHWLAPIAACCCDPNANAVVPLTPELAPTPDAQPVLFVVENGQEIQLDGVDANGDGIVDFSTVDSNGDGQVDTWFVDTNGDGVANVMLVDTDGDGLPDSASEDSAENGQWSQLEALPAGSFSGVDPSGLAPAATEPATPAETAPGDVEIPTSPEPAPAAPTPGDVTIPTSTAPTGGETPVNTSDLISRLELARETADPHTQSVIDETIFRLNQWTSAPWLQEMS